MMLTEIQRAAVQRFAAQGYAGTGIRELGRDVGLNSATLYHYASTKQDLLAGVMRLCLEELNRAADVALAIGRDPSERLAALVAVHVGLSARNPATSRVTDQEIRSLTGANLRDAIAWRDRYEAKWDGVLAAGAGVFTTDDTALTRLALLDMCSGVANWYQPAGRVDVAELQQRFAGLAARMVGVEPSAVQLRVPDVVLLACEPREAMTMAVGA